MRVLVTGGQGCIGAWIVKQLLDQSIEVVTYDLNPDPNRLALVASRKEMSRIEFHIGSIEDTHHVQKLVRDRGNPHCASCWRVNSVLPGQSGKGSIG